MTFTHRSCSSVGSSPARISTTNDGWGEQARTIGDCLSFVERLWPSLDTGTLPSVMYSFWVLMLIEMLAGT